MTAGGKNILGRADGSFKGPEAEHTMQEDGQMLGTVSQAPIFTF